MKKILLILLLSISINYMPAMASEDLAHYNSWLKAFEKILKKKGKYDTEMRLSINLCRKEFDSKLGVVDSFMTFGGFVYYYERFCKYL